MNQLRRSLWPSRLWFFIFWLIKLNLHINCYCVRGTRTHSLIFVGCSVHYWVPCAINKGGFFEIAFVVVVDTHLPRFEALTYVLIVPPSNLTRLYYNGSAAKSHSTTTQYRQLRRLAFAEVFHSVFVKRSSFKSFLNLRKAYIFQEFAEGLLSICVC